MLQINTEILHKICRCKCQIPYNESRKRRSNCGDKSLSATPVNFSSIVWAWQQVKSLKWPISHSTLAIVTSLRIFVDLLTTIIWYLSSIDMFIVNRIHTVIHREMLKWKPSSWVSDFQIKWFRSQDYAQFFLLWKTTIPKGFTILLKIQFTY